MLDGLAAEDCGRHTRDVDARELHPVTRIRAGLRGRPPFAFRCAFPTGPWEIYNREPLRIFLWG